MRISAAVLTGLCMGILARAQEPAPRVAQPPKRAAGADALRAPKLDAASVARGQQVFVAQCGFCHGANAKGGESGPDLVRSVVVLDDEGGREIGALLKAGRQDQGMPRFDMTAPQVGDIANFLHQRVADAAFRSTYQILDILTGDAKAGEAYFNGAGGCGNCHAVAADLKSIGAKYDVETLQGRVIMPRAGRGGGGNASAEAPRLAPTATVTLGQGKTFSGVLIRMTDFDVTIKEPSGVVRTFTRESEDNPKIVRTDPLRGHLDLLPKWKDTDIHNVTAYLVTLK